MEKAPKSLRLHIGVFGRTNVGKSSFLNLVAGQDVAITSPIPGTTTDVVEKTMELLPLGPVVFLDTAGIDDVSALGEKRVEKTRKVFARADIICLVTEAGKWGEFEDKVIEEARGKGVPVVGVVNRIDEHYPDSEFTSLLAGKTSGHIMVSSIDTGKRDVYLNALKEKLIDLVPDDFLKPPPILGDLVPRGGLAVLVVPIDKEAPKGRIILPQVQTIRDCLDNDIISITLKESEYPEVFPLLKRKPDLTVCDSQVVKKFVSDTPDGVKCTTFSILFSRCRGDLLEAVNGVRAVDGLKQGDKVLVAEACSHHAVEDDIGRVKLPRWLKEYLGHEVHIDVYAGRDYPENLSEYKLIIHCGGCMINRREMLHRINVARKAMVPVTNYGVCISHIQGVLERVLSPFPDALGLYKSSK